jgi:putative DNA primase/helicase
VLEYLRTQAVPAARLEDKIAVLAQLSVTSYEQVRTQEARDLGMCIAVLDDEVSKARKRQAESATPRTTPKWAPFPQTVTEPVIGQELIAELVASIQRFVMMDESAALVVALWILFTWTFEEVAETNPYLRIISAAPGCGKSTLLKVLRWLARSGWLLVRLSPSSFTRTMDNERRTLLLDEGDAFLHENETMRNLLDGASDPDTATVSLSVKSGDDWKPVELNVFVPIAIASIGPIRRMQTVEDRGIAIHLKRATGAELKPLDKGRRRTLKAALEPLALICAKWAADHGESLKGARPELPDEMFGREQDKWEPLIAIADSIGDDCGTRARTIAAKLSASRGDDGTTIGVMLINDLQSIFGGWMGFMPTTTICEKLQVIEARPWAEFGRIQKPISARALAALLKPFGIFPASDGNARGYKGIDLEDAFLRYLGSPSVKASETPRRVEESPFSDPSGAEPVDGSGNDETHGIVEQLTL